MGEEPEDWKKGIRKGRGTKQVSGQGEDERGDGQEHGGDGGGGGVGQDARDNE